MGQAACLGVCFLWTLCAFQSHPPSPPSKSTAARLATADAARAERVLAAVGKGGAYANRKGEPRDAASGLSLPGSSGAGVGHGDEGGGEGGAESPGAVVSRLFADFRSLLRDRNFVLLLVAFR